MAWVPRILALIVACVAIKPTIASGQAGFVQGGYGTDLRRFSANEDQRVFDGAAGSVLLGGGAFVTSRWTVGVELDLGQESTESRSVTVPVSGLPTTVTTAFSLDRRTLSALAGFHTTPAGAVVIGVYGGLSFSSVRRTIASDAPPVVVTTAPEPSVFVDRTTGPIAGVDVAVRIAPHLSVVGGLRAQGLTLTGELTGFSVRPFAAARVGF